MATQTTPARSAAEVVKSMCNSYASAVNAGDADAYSRLFTTDAIRMPPRTPPEHGRDEIRVGEQATYDVMRLEIRSTPTDALQIGDDWIYAIAGVAGIGTAKADGSKSAFELTKTWLLQKQESGEWFIARQMWN